MARKIRIEYAGAVYYVMARGNQGRDIYADDRDRKLWLETPADACEKTGCRLHAWAMMGKRSATPLLPWSAVCRRDRSSQSAAAASPCRRAPKRRSRRH